MTASWRAAGAPGPEWLSRARAAVAPSRWRGSLVRRANGMSLRARLIAVVTSLVVLALVMVSVVTLVVMYRVLLGQVDENLKAVTSSQQSFSALTSPGSDDGGYPSDYVVQTFDRSGVSLGPPQAPPNARHGSLVLSDVTLSWVRGHPKPMTVRVAGGGQWRIKAVVGQNRYTHDPVSIVVGLPLDDVNASVARVAGWLLGVGVAVVLAGGLLGTAAITRAFRPLREVEQVSAAFGGGDLSRRVATTAPGTEVGRLGSAVNAMLDRIVTSLEAREASEERMRRFVADASHELRTPLAAVRGFAELHRIGAVREPADVSRAFDRIETEATRMGGLVEDLLLLARLDEQRPMKQEPVDLLLISADAAADARALDPARTVSVVGVDGAPPSPVVVTGDDARLRQVLTNLVANALRHTPAGTPVEIGVGLRAGWALWRVVDHGPGIAPTDAQHVFERFWRADSSRQRGAGGGAGLGMSIVSAIVAAHSGAVRVVTTPGGGATIEVALPPAAVPQPVPDEDAEHEDAEHDAPAGPASMIMG